MGITARLCLCGCRQIVPLKPAGALGPPWRYVPTHNPRHQLQPKDVRREEPPGPVARIPAYFQEWDSDRPAQRSVSETPTYEVVWNGRGPMPHEARGRRAWAQKRSPYDA